MVAKSDALGDGCRRELARSLHMSFSVWQPGGVVTQPCDGDIQRLCLLAHPSLQQMPGAVGACLARVVGWLGGWGLVGLAGRSVGFGYSSGGTYSVKKVCRAAVPY